MPIRRSVRGSRLVSVLLKVLFFPCAMVSCAGVMWCIGRWYNPESLKSVHHEGVGSSGRLLLVIEHYMSQGESGSWESSDTEAVVLDTGDGRKLASRDLDDREDPVVHTPGVLWTVWSDRSRLKAYDFGTLSERFDSKGRIGIARTTDFELSEDGSSLVFTSAQGRRSQLEWPTGQLREADEPERGGRSRGLRPEDEAGASLTRGPTRWRTRELAFRGQELAFRDSTRESLGTFFDGRLVAEPPARTERGGGTEATAPLEECLFVVHKESLATGATLRVTKLDPATRRQRWWTPIPDVTKAEAAFLEREALLVVGSGAKGAVSVTAIRSADGTVVWKKTRP